MWERWYVICLSVLMLGVVGCNWILGIDQFPEDGGMIDMKVSDGMLDGPPDGPSAF